MSGCAVGADGQLLDASEIQFFNGVDDDIPISGHSDVPTRPAHSIHPQLTGVHSPALNAAGSRRTTHTLRLSTKRHDPCNAEASVPAKRRLGLLHLDSVTNVYVSSTPI